MQKLVKKKEYKKEEEIRAGEPKTERNKKGSDFEAAGDIHCELES